MTRPEDSRVKIPALVYFTRLGYNYMSLKHLTRNVDYDGDTNIFYELFRDAVNQINGLQLSIDETKKIIEEIKIKLGNNDLGKAFFQYLQTGIDSIRIFDYEIAGNNNYTVVTELPYENGDERENCQILFYCR